MPTDGYQNELAVIDRVMQTGQGEMLTGLRDNYSQAILPGPTGPLVPNEAMVTPLTLDSAVNRTACWSWGISPYLRLDEEYRSFLTLVATQVGVALADSRAL